MSHTTSKNACAACGSAPTNHKIAFAMSLLDDFLSKIDKGFFRLSERPLLQKMADWVEKILFFGAYILGIATLNKDDVEKTTIGRSKIIWEEAKRRGIQMEQIVIFGKPTDHFRAKLNGKFFYFHSLPIPPKLLQTGYKWVDDKMRLAEELHEAGLPAPRTKKVMTLREAKKAFADFQKPVIIKPEWGSRGRHTTTNINTLEEMENAFRLAKQITSSMVLQEHLTGSVYRATVIDNKLVGFFRADQPKVTGNGAQTIRELIEEKNKTRHERVSPIIINKDLEDFIGRNGYNLETILKEGETIILSAKTGRFYGSYTKEMLPEIHPKMHGIFERAGMLCEAPVLGFDLIMEDPTKDPDEQRFGIIECNSLPFIDLHFMALEGEPIDLSKNVWDLWKK